MELVDVPDSKSGKLEVESLFFYGFLNKICVNLCKAQSIDIALNKFNCYTNITQKFYISPESHFSNTALRTLCVLPISRIKPLGSKPRFIHVLKVFALHFNIGNTSLISSNSIVFSFGFILSVLFIAVTSFVLCSGKSGRENFSVKSCNKNMLIEN